MLILIEKDPSTKVPKDVTPEEAAGFAKDYTVHVVNADGSTAPFDAEVHAPSVPAEAPATGDGAVHTDIETKVYPDGTEVTGKGPLPADSPTEA